MAVFNIDFKKTSPANVKKEVVNEINGCLNQNFKPNLIFYIQNTQGIDLSFLGSSQIAPYISCVELKNLNVDTDINLSFLANTLNLKRLSLPKVEFNVGQLPGFLALLKNLTNLKKLELNFSNIEDVQNYSSFKLLTKLEELTIYFGEEFDLSFLNYVPSLEKLNLIGWKSEQKKRLSYESDSDSDEENSSVDKYTWIENSILDFAPLRNLSKLKYLSLINLDEPNFSLKYLENHPNLESLNLVNSDCSGVVFLNSVKNLKMLTLSQSFNEENDVWLEILVDHPSLKKVKIESLKRNLKVSPSMDYFSKVKKIYLNGNLLNPLNY